MKLEKRGDVDQQQEPIPKAEPEPVEPKTMKKRQTAVLVYVAILFIVALGLVVLSYFIQQRRTNDTINNINAQHSEFSIQALQNIEDLQNKNIDLQNQLEEDEDTIAELNKKVQELQDENESIENTRKQENETLGNKVIAFERLIDLINVKDSEDTEQVNKALKSAEEFAQYLDGTYTQIYVEIKAEIEAQSAAETGEE
jgi:predicted  nucleic acid-binding Zn-ribbon protein